VYSLLDPFKREPKNIFLGDFRRCRSDGGVGFVVVFDGTRVESVTVSVEEGLKGCALWGLTKVEGGGLGVGTICAAQLCSQMCSALLYDGDCGLYLF